jgi:wyosine [tRNA(Phe)-imidazoG37] synthetase (radical SAM superfamily)
VLPGFRSRGPRLIVHAEPVESETSMSAIFGPVPSRRLGLSLGIDVIAAKTCSYDCVYCESGRTTHLSVERKPFVPPGDVLDELEAFFKAHPGGAEALTFSSAGEPTLYEPLGELLAAIKRRFANLPLVVLTNGSLLWDPRVRRDLLAADRVVPTLSTLDREGFKRLHRPHPSLDIEAVSQGIKAFRTEYKGELCLEVMLVRGYNDDPAQWAALSRFIDSARPDRVELNTVARPPAEPCARALSLDQMEHALEFFPKPITRIIGRFAAEGMSESEAGLADRVLELAARRPCTPGEMAASLRVSSGALEATLAKLEEDRKLIRSFFNGEEYLRLPTAEGGESGRIS